MYNFVYAIYLDLWRNRLTQKQFNCASSTVTAIITNENARLENVISLFHNDKFEFVPNTFWTFILKVYDTILLAVKHFNTLNSL